MNAGVAAAGYVLAALMVGLWWGERGRRLAAERLLVHGSPIESAGTPTSGRVPRDAEDRLEKFSEDTVERAVSFLRAEAERQGIEGVTDEQLRADALEMLAGRDVGPPM